MREENTTKMSRKEKATAKIGPMRTKQNDLFAPADDGKAVAEAEQQKKINVPAHLLARLTYTVVKMRCYQQSPPLTRRPAKGYGATKILKIELSSDDEAEGPMPPPGTIMPPPPGICHFLFIYYGEHIKNL